MSGEATYLFYMGYIRLIHFCRRDDLTVLLLGRIYWACVGNRWPARAVYRPETGVAVGGKALSPWSAGIRFSEKTERHRT